MKLATFWHIMIGLNMGLCVVSWILQDSSLLALNILSAVACGFAAHFAKIREENRNLKN